MPKKKTTSTKKKAVKKTAAPSRASSTKKVKKVAKKAPAKKASAKKAPAKKVSAKKTPAKKASAKKASAKKAIAPRKKTSVARTGLSADRKSTPIVFSIDDVVELVASKKSDEAKKPTKKVAKKAAKKALSAHPKKTIIEEQPVEKRVLGAASLADILGFNPSEKKKNTSLADKDVPKKWQKYYKLLIELRHHVSDEIDLHTADTLKHSSRDDSGDLSSYSNHQADAGTDTFDRDFALSLVSNEQEALNEIEEAIMRIKDGSYGVCEVTGKSIPAARLTAVPFTRYSVEGQVEYEKNLRHKVDRSSNTGLFGDGSEAPKIASSDDDDE